LFIAQYRGIFPVLEKWQQAVTRFLNEQSFKTEVGIGRQLGNSVSENCPLLGPNGGGAPSWLATSAPQ
jgi:hypothetical protein